MTRAALLPVPVPTGFPGSGKITLPGRLTRRAGSDRTACAINAFDAFLAPPAR